MNRSGPLDNLLQPNFHHERQQHESRRRLVTITFLTSLASFIAAVCYDYVRPAYPHRLLLFLESVVRTNFDHSCASPKTNALSMAPALIEILLLVPLLLSVLPLTKRFGKRISSTTVVNTRRKGTGKDCRGDNESQQRMNYLRTVLRIMEGVAWTLWTIAGVVLVTGVLCGGKIFGLISISALLALFAQGVGAVGFLALSTVHIQLSSNDTECSSDSFVGAKSPVTVMKEDDDIFRESRCLEKEEIVTMVAGAWMRKDDDHFSMKKEGDLYAPDAKVYKMWASSSGKHLDIIIFFLVNTVLLHSPYYLHVGFQFLAKCVNCGWNERFADFQGVRDGPVVLTIEIPAVMAFLSTIMTPLFTHGIGGEIFVGKGWSFHHPFEGGKQHVTAQATGWSLLCMAALLHLCFLGLGMRNQYVFLLHSGSIMSWCAEGLLLYSLLTFQPKVDPLYVKKQDDKMEHGYRSSTCRPLIWHILSFAQDLVLTNMHWFYLLWLTSTLFGFNAFSLDPMEKVFNISRLEAMSNFSLLICVWFLAAVIIPYSSKRRRWKFNPFGLLNDAFEKFLFHPNGLFHDSRLEHEDKLVEYIRDGCMFGIAPHGALPTSAWAVLHQFQHIFGEVCLFFGSQIALCPGYRYICAMRGGLLPIEKRRLVEVMKTRQNVALVPGGVSEMMHCEPRAKRVKVSIKHKGFVRLAIQQGYDLVPTIFFHANDSFDNPMKDFQLWTYKKIGIPIGLPWYSNRWRLPLSNRKPMRVALGRRISVKQCSSPSTNEIDNVHRLFYEEVYRVWEKYKGDFGYADRELLYVT